jgi:hypothetical protein
LDELRISRDHDLGRKHDSCEDRLMSERYEHIARRSSHVQMKEGPSADAVLIDVSQRLISPTHQFAGIDASGGRDVVDQGPRRPLVCLGRHLNPRQLWDGARR